MADFIYLASQSPRADLLLPGADEDAEALEAEREGESPDAYVQRVTLAKLDAALARLQRRGLPAAPVLCSDTTVALGSRILGKPLDAHDALATLRLLSGQEHRVLTAVALGEGARRMLRLNVSTVRFAPVEDAALRRYADSGEPMGKAGAYAIQSQAAAWISHISGSYSGIMGLPLFETAELLAAFGHKV